MIIPSIDLENGRAVQLRGGEEKMLDAGDPRPLAERFGRVGEIAVIDLDRARGRGENDAVVHALLSRARCRVGGGVRDADRALHWLDRGAASVIVGTAATPELLRRLPAARVQVALDSVDGEVVDQGWQRRTGRRVEERIDELAPYCGGFLLTMVENEGRLGGVDEERAARWRERAGELPITVAGGVREAGEIGRLHRLGIDAQVGMALYRGHLDLASALWACLRSDREDGLVPTIVCDASERALGLAWSDEESLRAALDRGRGVYRSRSRGQWVKGESSGATQQLLDVALDCDADALRFRVEQAGAGFCHRDRVSCFGDARGLAALERTLVARRGAAPEGSYTARLFDDPSLLAAKLREEAQELAEARTRDEIVHEAADLIYFSAVRMAASGVPWSELEAELDRRARAVRRRGGERKDLSA